MVPSCLSEGNLGYWTSFPGDQAGAGTNHQPPLPLFQGYWSVDAVPSHQVGWRSYSDWPSLNYGSPRRRTPKPWTCLGLPGGFIPLTPSWECWDPKCCDSGWKLYGGQGRAASSFLIVLMGMCVVSASTAFRVLPGASQISKPAHSCREYRSNGHER